MATTKFKSRNERTTVEEKIETEQARLMKAEAVLHCVVVAMDEGGEGGTDGPDYQGAIEVARELVGEAIDQLDSVRVRALAGGMGERRGYEVKDGVGEYMH